MVTTIRCARKDVLFSTANQKWTISHETCRDMYRTDTLFTKTQKCIRTVPHAFAAVIYDVSINWKNNVQINDFSLNCVNFNVYEYGRDFMLLFSFMLIIKLSKVNLFFLLSIL